MSSSCRVVAGRESGLTLIEIVFTVAIFAIVAVALAGTLLAGQRAFQRGLASEWVTSSARQIVDRIVPEIKQAGRSTIVMSPSTSDATSITFQPNIGYNAFTRTIVYGPPITFARAGFGADTTGDASDDENINDSTDNNGNGLTNECILTRTENGQSNTLGAFLVKFNSATNRSGLSFRLIDSSPDDYISIQVTIERIDPVDGELIRDATTTMVVIKND